MIKTNSLIVHHGLASNKSTRLPLRTILGHWARELGVNADGYAVFPGPRNNPGNVTKAHVGRVCGYLGGFPSFCTTLDGVLEYNYYFNEISYYKDIATKAAGNWKVACDLIEQSPWSATHYGGTLDATAGQIVAQMIKSTVRLANVREKPTRASKILTTINTTVRLAYDATVTGEMIGTNNKWYRVRYGTGNGKFAFIHSSVSTIILLG